MSKLTQEEYDEALMEEMEEQQSEDHEDGQDDNYLNQMELQEAYGSPEPDEVMNQHSLIFKAVDAEDTIRTTYLNEQELGRPLFNIRFLMDIHDVTRHYIDPLVRKLGLNPAIDNRLANYFNEKIRNITESGMSSDGFALKLNSSRIIESTKKRVRDISGLKNQGKQK